MGSGFHQRKNQVIPFKSQAILLRVTEDQMLMFYWLKCHHHGGQCLL